MENEEIHVECTPDKLQKRREKMPDAKRYIIYYTFGDSEVRPQSEESDNV